MDANLSDEQVAFTEVAADLAADLAARWRRGRSPDTVDRCAPSPADWRKLADAGWLALRSDDDGAGIGTCVDVCLLAEQLGYHAVPAPVLGTLLLVEQLRLRCAPREIVTPLVSGQVRMAPVLTRDLRSFALDSDAIGFDTAGATAGVLAAATELRTYSLTGSATGADLTRELASLDVAQVAEGIPLAAASGECEAALSAFALTVVSADLLGVMRGAFDHALAHAKAREQFGVPIGSFQAIQHIAAECHVSIEATRSAVWYSAWTIDELPAREALSAARTAKAFASSAAIEVVEACVQILGGIGITWESPAHVWQRRAHLDRMLFGDEYYQGRMLAAA